MQKVKNTIPLVFLIFVTLWLRLINLGYSNYQGDEIRALYLPQPGQNLVDFLFSQRKGPFQFLVTYAISFFNPEYNNEFLIRLPFTIAGILAIYFFYKFVKLEFGQKIAIYSSLFMAINGLFVAFARIVQYQSFVILFSLLCLYFLSLSTKYNQWKIYGLYLGMFCWSLSMLSHFDAIFILPFVMILLKRWYLIKNELSTNLKIKILAFAFTILLLLLASFYMPFFLFSISDSTKSYWYTRFRGSPDNAITTFTAYNTLFATFIYTILIFLSIFRIKEQLSIVAWLCFPLFFMEILIAQPKTHIYTYVLPLCVLAAFGLEKLEIYIVKIFKFSFTYIPSIVSGGIFILLSLLSHTIFIENTREYPWESKNFFIWQISQPPRIALFGFPYNRRWEDIGTFIKSTNSTKYYITNDKAVIAEYYIGRDFQNIIKTPNLDINNLSGDVYVIYIYRTQHRQKNILGKDDSYWQENYKPVKTFYHNGRVVANIYRLSVNDLKTLSSQGLGTRG